MKVFLSHSTKDAAFVQRLADGLRTERLEPWLCEVDIDYGQNFVAKIEEGLRDADLTVLVWSPEAAGSAWTQVATEKAPKFFLDFEPVDFVGRAALLERLYGALAEQPGAFLLHGEPGSGKTTLALKFAWQAQGRLEVVAMQVCGQRRVEEIVGKLAGRLKLDVGTLLSARETDGGGERVAAATACVAGVFGETAQ